MSRSHRFLAVVFVAMLSIVGIARWVGGSSASVQGALVSPTASSSGSPDTSPAVPVTVPAPTPCAIPEALQVGSSGDAVQCLEAWLAAAGYLTVPPDNTFDTATEAAVRAMQAAELLAVDGIVGKQTAAVVGEWTGPEGSPEMVDADCPSTPHAAVVDRANQRGALCENGVITVRFPITSAQSQPDPGEYDVYAKDLDASSNLSGQYSTMTHFVAFTRGKYQGARIAFHSVPKYSDGSWVQPLESVGTPEYFGASAGCIRVLPDDAVRIWDWLSIGDLVHVIS
ncbi:MAG: L,D-transpeptidase family protein [Ilumatobacteraceae bacterium]